MTLTNKKSLFLLIFSFIFVSSCETLEDLAGLNKVDIDDTLYEGTPDLILPPDFNKDPTTLKRTKTSTNQQISQENYQQMLPYQTVNPRVTNFFSPKINVESSSTPSDSLEKFKQNKRFIDQSMLLHSFKIKFIKNNKKFNFKAEPDLEFKKKLNLYFR